MSGQVSPEFKKLTGVPLKVLGLISLLLFLIVSSLLPLVSFGGYSIIGNTTSHLGAQGSPYAWIMNMVFIVLGITALIKTAFTGPFYATLFGALFGISLIMTGIFQHAPLAGVLQANELHDSLHSLFATTTGFSFTLFATGHAFMSRKGQRTAAIAVAIIAAIVPLNMFNIPSIMGIAQRLMFLIAFSWLFFYYENPGNTTRSYSFKPQ